MSDKRDAFVSGDEVVFSVYDVSSFAAAAKHKVAVLVFVSSRN